VEALEDRTVLSAPNPFYDLTRIASTSSNGFTSFGDLVSVNSAGDAVFVGSTSQDNGLYVVKAGTQVVSG
jgi:L-aminopeptidase/D-esterase-like protein